MLNKKSTLHIALAALAVACSLALPATAHAARVCTEVTGPSGAVALACRNVPDNPAPSTPAAPATPTAPATPAQPAPQPVAGNADTAPLNTATLDHLGSLRKEAFAGIAQAAALAPLLPSGVGKTTVNLGAGQYGGESAVGLSFAHRPTQNLFFSGGLSKGTSGKSLFQLSAGFQF